MIALSNIRKILEIHDNKGTSPIDAQGIVKRIEGSTAYVRLNGATIDTPVRRTIDCEKGDTVQVRVTGTGAWITGNLTAPPTDDKTAKAAGAIAASALKKSKAAQGDAETAKATADNAMTSANGKNKIYRQSTEPTGGTYVEGDIWFDTSSDNQIHRYNGTAWVAVTLGDDAIGNLNASHITAGTIDASQITVSNLDAGNITSGKLDAAYIKTSTLVIADMSDASDYAKTADVPTDVSELTDQQNVIANAASTAATSAVSGKANASDAVKRSQRIYYRSSSTTAPGTPNAWVTATTEANNTWLAAKPPAIDTSNTSYKYIWACEQREMVNETLSHTTVARDLSSTVIDGGSIQTGQIDAQRINTTGLSVGSVGDSNGYHVDTDANGIHFKYGSTELAEMEPYTDGDDLIGLVMKSESGTNRSADVSVGSSSSYGSNAGLSAQDGNSFHASVSVYANGNESAAGVDIDAHEFTVSSHNFEVDKHGNVIVKGHSNPIGTNYSASGNVSKSSGTTYGGISGCYVTLPAGVWIVNYSCYCNIGASGKTLAAILTNTTDIESDYAESRAIAHTSNSDPIAVTGSMVLDQTNANTNQRISLRTYQTSGSSKNVYGYINAVRIA